MSYQVIARKWRPQTFDEVTGQEHITRTLRNALAYDRLHHAYLFSGARGVGKTTTARLLAKALNCHKTDKPTLEPCRTDDPTACPSCVEISESRSMDVLEIDAASHTGIENVRETIIETINVNPVRDRFKAFIIDEVHQLSKPAFNALLKTLEEPPENVVFVMATTELHKVPETIRSRCQEFDFRTIPLQKIFDRLKLIAKAEKISIDEAALREIARSGMGSMRDAQSNFDQVISFSDDKISVPDVTNALGIASTEMLTRVVKAIGDRSPKVMFDVVAEIISRGQDMRNFCRDLLAVLRDLLVYKVSGGDVELIESSVLSTDEVNALSAPFSEADLLRFFNSISETESSLKEAAQPRYVLETGLVKLTEMRRVVAIEELLERLGVIERQSGSDTVAEKSFAAATPEKKTLNSEPATPEIDIEPEPVVPTDTSFVEDSTPLAETFDEPPAPTRPPIDLSFVDSLPIKLPPIASEDLEHIEDSWLDAAYERKLARTGDDLFPIREAPTLVRTLLGNVGDPTRAVAANGSAGAGVAPALSVVFTPPVLDEPEESSEPASLPADATEDQIRMYAASHPLTRKVARVFRATIVDVDRT